MGDMVYIKATGEVKEVISVVSGLDDNDNEEYYTVCEDGRAYKDDDYVTVVTENEVDAAIAEFMRNYKCGLANIYKYGVKQK